MPTTVRLKEWRLRRGFSFRALAREAGVAVSTVQQIEAGERSPTVEMLDKLAGPLDVDVHDLLSHPRRPGKQGRKASAS